MPQRLASIVSAALLAATALPAAAAPPAGAPPRIVIDLPVTTQGPLWPPATVTDADGDFPVVGISLIEFAGFPGIPLFGQAVLVSKDSVPPLDENGDKVNNNWFLASYTILRPLDLSPGSPDLDTVLHSLSYGPPDASGVPRIPRVGDSLYNLYTDPAPCPDVFPSSSQVASYTRPRFPLHRVPILGFQGDQVGYDVDTGDPYLPVARGGPGCESGCPGEDLLDTRRAAPITLGEWLRGRARLTITLRDLDGPRHAYTAADFHVVLRDALPSTIYTVFAVRPRRLPGADFTPQADPLGMPSVIATDDQGRGEATFRVVHPFPDPAADPAGLRIVGVVVSPHPDNQNWGACGAILGAGVDIQTQFNSLVEGNIDFTPFVTVPPGG
jgi:hypothetical protein